MRDPLDNLGDDVYADNEYFAKKLSGKVLVTTRNGSWELLENEDYERLRKMNVERNSTLFRRLENAGIILTKKNTAEVIKRYIKQYDFLSINKMMYILSFSRACNLRCGYCHADATQFSPEKIDKKISRETMDAILNFIYSAPFQDIAIEFQGGEPLLQFREIAYFLDLLHSGAAENNKKIEVVDIVTNMTMMNEEIAKFAIEKNIGLCASLDGPKELHDSQRQYLDGRGSYETVTRWIKYFQKNGKRISMMPTITSNSLKFGAKKVIDEYVKWNCKSIFLKPVVALGRAKKNNGLGVSAKDFFNFWKEGVEYLVKLNLEGIEIYDRNTQYHLRNILLPYRAYMCGRRPCGAGISQLAFSEDGNIYACDFGRSMPSTTAGKVGKSSFADIVLKTMDSRTFSQEFQPLCDLCVFNAYCPTCTSRNQSVYKDIAPHRPNDFNCATTQMMLSYLFEKMQDEKYKKVFSKWVWLNG